MGAPVQTEAPKLAEAIEQEIKPAAGEETTGGPVVEEKNKTQEEAEAPVSLSGITSDTIVRPGLEQQEQPKAEAAKSEDSKPKPRMVELANNSDFSVATIAKQANRLKRKEDGEVFISLH
jgi:hypothetical protein